MAHPRKADVLIADAEPVARAGLIYLINSHPALRVCAEAEDLKSARALVAKHRPAVAVLDVAMGDGVAFIKDLPRWSRGTRAVVFTARAEAMDVQRALQAGACGYVVRRDPVVALMAAIVGALSGEQHVGPLVERTLLKNLSSGAVEMRGSEVSALSNRELQIFRMIGRGLPTREVAEELSVSVKTVETHRQRIKEKLHVTSGAELQRRAVLFHGKTED